MILILYLSYGNLATFVDWKIKSELLTQNPIFKKFLTPVIRIDLKILID